MTAETTQAATDAAMGAALDTLALACRILEMEGHGSRTLGHVALRDPGGEGFWLKRKDITFAQVADRDDFVLLDFDGRKLAGEGRPPREWPIHSELLAMRPDVNVTMHSHPFHARIFSACDEPLRAVSSIGTCFDEPPPKFSAQADLILTKEEGRAVAEVLGEHPAVFLRNHGVVFCGETIAEAVMIGVRLEEACKEQLVVMSLGVPWSEHEGGVLRDAGRARRLDSAERFFAYETDKLAEFHPGGEGPAHPVLLARNGD